MTSSSREPQDDDFGDPSRRTYLATERTLLAWWRTALATIAIALGVGRLIPAVAHVPKVPYLALGSAYGLLAMLFVIYGTVRQIALSRALEAGRFEQLHGAVINVLTGFLVLLSLATIVLLSFNS